MAEFEVSFDVNPPSVEAEFEVESTEIDATFLLYAYGMFTFADGLKEEDGVVKVIPATGTTIGGVIIGENIIVDAEGKIEVPYATNSSNGVIRIATDTEVEAAVSEVVAVNPKQLSDISGHIEELIAQLRADLEAEIARAKAAEEEVQTNLDLEVTRAENAESQLTSSLNAEVERAVQSENELSTKISTETSRATAAEESLDTKIEAETTRAEGAESTLTSSLNNEVTRATAAEEQLAASISAETTRATEEEGALQVNINAEANRAEAAEQALSDSITAEISRAEAAEGTLQTNIDNEVSRAKKAEEDLGTSVAAEKVRAEKAEGELQGSIVAETTRAVKIEGEIYDSLTAETTRATTAEGSLSTSIAAETTRAEGAESTLTTNLSNEVTRATTAEGNLDTKIEAETTRATTAEGNLDTKIEAETTRATTAEGSLSTSIAAETARAEGVEGGLQTSIDTINGKIPEQATTENQLADKSFVNSSIATATANFVGTFDTLEELEAVENPTNNDYGFVKTLDSAGNTVYNRYKYVASTKTWKFEYALNNSSFTAKQWTSINSGATPELIAQITANQTAIANEVTRATTAEGELSTSITAETTRATTAEGTLQTNITAEETRAKGAEEALANSKQDKTTAVTHEASTAVGSATKPIYIKADGTTAEITSYEGTAAKATADASGNVITTTYATKTEVNAKQDKLTAGANIQITNNTISATDTTYTAGDGIKIEGTTISNTRTSAEWGKITGTLSDQTDLNTALSSKQDTISDLATIRSNATAGKSASDTIATYGNIVTHNVSEFATATQGTLADSALQPNDNISELNNDVGYTTNVGTITGITMNGTSKGTSGVVDLGTVITDVSGKQDKLTAGSNIQITGTTISATDTTYTAGTGIDITNNVISSTQTSAEWGKITGTLSDQTDLQNALNEKQHTLTAGTNITIVDNVISATGDVSVGWGKITGTLSDQIDLQSALNAKQDLLTSDNAGDNITISIGGSVIVPSDYTQLSYVQNNASTRVASDIIPTSSVQEWYCRFYCGTTNSFYIFLSRATSPNIIYGIAGSSSNATISFSISNSSVTSSITRTIGHIYTTKATCDSAGTITLYVKDETDGTEATETGTLSSFTVATSPICLFGNKANNYLEAGTRIMEAYYKEDGVEKLHYIPAKNSSSTIGFYDTVSKSLVTAEAGSLVAGDVVEDVLKISAIVPTKTSELTNNSGFITSSGSITGNAATATKATQDRLGNQIDTTYATVTELNGKQDTLTAGNNIQITGTTISATDTTYTAGTGIDITNNVISSTQTSAEWGKITGTLSDQTDLNTALDNKQNKLTAGSNISITAGTYKEVEYVTVTNQRVDFNTTFVASNDWEIEFNIAFNTTGTQPIFVGSINNGVWLGLLDGYFVVRTYNGSNHILAPIPTIGQMTNIKVTHTSDGATELFYDDVSQGTAIISFVNSTTSYLFSDGWSIGQVNFNEFKLTTQGTVKYDILSAKLEDTYALYNLVTENVVSTSGSAFTGGAVKESGRIPEGIIISATVPTAVSQLTNDIGYITSAYHDNTKQDTLTAGANIQITNNTISATNTTYNAGTGIGITNNVISVENPVIATFKANGDSFVCDMSGTEIANANNNGKLVIAKLPDGSNAFLYYAASAFSAFLKYTADIYTRFYYVMWSVTDTVVEGLGYQASKSADTYIHMLSDNVDGLSTALAAKQDTISDLATIRSNATAGKSASDTISGYGNIVTHNTSEFATAAQGTLADSALQPNDNISELTNDAGYTTNVGTITGITMNGASKGTSGVVDLGTVITDISGKQDTLTAGTNISIIDNVVGTSAATVVFKEWRV